jgi:high-affinity Fe2+/Pb2+ permease
MQKILYIAKGLGLFSLAVFAGFFIVNLAAQLSQSWGFPAHNGIIAMLVIYFIVGLIWMLDGQYESNKNLERINRKYRS